MYIFIHITYTIYEYEINKCQKKTINIKMKYKM